MSCLALGHDARSSHQHDRQSIEISGMRRHNEDGSVLRRCLLAPHRDPVETPKQEEQSHDPAHQCLRIATSKHHHTWLLDQNRTQHNAVTQAYDEPLEKKHIGFIKGCFNSETSFYCTRLSKASFSPGRKVWLSVSIIVQQDATMYSLGFVSPWIIIYSNKSTNQMHHSLRVIACRLTLILLTWRKWWAPNNASKQQMGFNSEFKALNTAQHVSGILMSIIRSLSIAVAVSGLPLERGGSSVPTVNQRRLLQLISSWWWTWECPKHIELYLNDKQ